MSGFVRFCPVPPCFPAGADCRAEGCLAAVSQSAEGSAPEGRAGAIRCWIQLSKNGAEDPGACGTAAETAWKPRRILPAD
jgi:hypothetical protein